MNVVLASASPRRQELLRTLVPLFESLSADVDESPLPGEAPEPCALRLATDKALAVARLRPNALVIGGDTVVAVDGEMLAKPEDAHDAARMLRLLSGRTHAVSTGICLVEHGATEGFVVTTHVTFRAVTDGEIAAYVATGEPMDKAGGYAIQGGAGEFVSAVEGSLSNVIGLPLEELEARLRARGTLPALPSE